MPTRRSAASGYGPVAGWPSPASCAATRGARNAYLRSFAGVSHRRHGMAQNMAQNIALTFPDGARRDYPAGTTGLDIAKGISPSLAKRTVAMALNGTAAALADPIEHDAKIEFLNRDDPRARELIR